MPVTFKTFVTNYDVAPLLGGLPNVIVRVHWKRTATRNGKEVVEYGTLPLPPPDPLVFVPIANVTKQHMATWYQSIVPAPLIAAANARMTAKLDELDAPSAVLAKPSWSPGEEVISG